MRVLLVNTASYWCVSKADLWSLVKKTMCIDSRKMQLVEVIFCDKYAFYHDNCIHFCAEQIKLCSTPEGRSQNWICLECGVAGKPEETNETRTTSDWWVFRERSLVIDGLAPDGATLFKGTVGCWWRSFPCFCGGFQEPHNEFIHQIWAQSDQQFFLKCSGHNQKICSHLC